LFFAMRANVTGAMTIDAKLLLVGVDGAGNSYDLDRDAFPSAAHWPTVNAAAAQLYATSLYLLDCDDDTDMPSVGRTAASINPFATELCTDGVDEDCDGMVAPCADSDGDGDPAGDDCDDSNPARHHPTMSDPFPDPPNCCGYSLGIASSNSQYHMNLAGSALCPTPRCGDGIDEACKGSDTACIVDADCDGYSPPLDCDDNDPATHPGALEPCGSTKDLNCSGVIGDACVNCDLDGDGYERTDGARGCPDANDRHPGLVDCNDFDSGVHPGQTSELSGSGTEGGNPASAVTMIASALRGNCRRYYDTAGSTYPKITVGTALAGDADCNGTAYENCPTVPCDADGDGFQNASCSPPAGLLDCNDSDPTIFPGAPDKCGDGVVQDCVADVACGSIVDNDGDGYDLANGDCDDNNSNIHPWATEVCDGIDNDCDGLVDEGNPTTNGAILTTGGNVTSCITDKDGECGKTSGICVCSPGTPATKFDSNPANRVDCPTEVPGSVSPKTPQCFFSGQPSLEICDGLDNECAGPTFVDGSQQCAGATPTCQASTHTCVPQ
jgi:hypothetical protein